MLSRTLNLGRSLVALKHPGFRWFLLGRVAASLTIYMRSVADGWLVYDKTGSALWLGWVSLAGSLTTLLLAPVGGVVADRFEKRSVLLVTRAVLLVVSAVVLASLIFSGQLQAWHIAVSAMLNGAVFSFMEPAQETIYSELVDRETVLNAVSLNFVIQGLLGILGSAAAGLLIDAEGIGAGGVYVGRQRRGMDAVSDVGKDGRRGLRDRLWRRGGRAAQLFAALGCLAGREQPAGRGGHSARGRAGDQLL
jgi:MFS family permease